jgi:chromosome segregation ATPase
VLQRERETHKERVLALEQHVVKASDEKHTLRVENELLSSKLQRCKDHYQEYDAKRQQFLDEKKGEMKALKKELKKAVDMQRDTQALLLTKIEEHRALQQAHNTLKQAVDNEHSTTDSLRDTIRKLHEAQVLTYHARMRRCSVGHVHLRRTACACTCEQVYARLRMDACTPDACTLHVTRMHMRVRIHMHTCTLAHTHARA